MNTAIGSCPICGSELTVTRLECGHCGTEIAGHFSLGRLYRVSPEDIQFIETFIKNRGNAYRVGEELEMPYSAVRSRLTEIIRRLGYETTPEAKDESSLTLEQRKLVLDQLGQGKISSEQAIRLLQGESPQEAP